MNAKLQTIVTVVIYALALLSIAAGIPKILQMPQELGFLESIGFSRIAVSMLGLVQLTGGILLFGRRLRLLGAVLAAAALLVSSIAIFVSGDTRFGLISLLPLVVLIIVIFGDLRGVQRSDT